MSRPQDDFWLGVQIAMMIGCAAIIVWFVVIAIQRETPQERIEAKLDQLIQLQDQTVDFLSDLHAEKEKAR